MEACLFYLLKMLCCSAILYGYYRVALYNECFHQWNRFYLLASMILSAIIPVLNISIVKQDEANNLSNAISYLPWNSITKTQQPLISWQQVLLYASLIISTVLLARLASGIIKISRLLKGNTIIGLQNNISLILTSVKDAPFSFLNWLFWRQDIDPGSDNGKRILNHELTHIREGHTVDKLLASVLVSVFWMNPFFWLIQKELGIVHEFLADRKAIGKEDGAAFANMILQSIIVKPGINTNLVNPFFPSTIKRRLFMITSSKLAKYSYLRRVSGLVVMIFSTAVLALTIQQAGAQQTKKPVRQTDPISPTKPTPAASSKPAIEPMPATQLIKVKADTVRVNRNVNANTVVHAANDNVKIVAPGKIAATKSNIAISSTNGKEPIYVVDGKIVEANVVSNIDPNTIQSVSVLKGESATNKYGIKAKDGAVEITMKNNDALVVKDNTTQKETVTISNTQGKQAKSPVFYVDGKEINSEEMNKIKPNDIESINVLKGEKAKEKYGDKGKDGVVEITMKKSL